MKYIINKNEKLPLPVTPMHHVDAFVDSIVPTLKILLPYYLKLAKSKIFAKVWEYEMGVLMQEGQGPTYGNNRADFITGNKSFEMFFIPHLLDENSFH
jgi:hypothetical protein